MSKDLIIVPDQHWNAYQKEIQHREHQEMLQAGYIAGRYTDLDFSVEEEAGQHYIRCHQKIKLGSLLEDLRSIAKLFF